MSQTKPRIVLASSSPRRAQLLSSLGIDFTVEPSQVIERPHPDERPEEYIIRLARAKAAEVAFRHPGSIVIGADTEVIVEDRVMGKPLDADDAKRMLALLSGRRHAVATGIAIRRGDAEVFGSEKTLVKFVKMAPAQIDWYVKTGEPFDKAGAYGIQGAGGLFIEEISGNYHNVVGLPLVLLNRLMEEVGFSLI